MKPSYDQVMDLVNSLNNPDGDGLDNTQTTLAALIVLLQSKGILSTEEATEVQSLIPFSS